MRNKNSYEYALSKNHNNFHENHLIVFLETKQNLKKKKEIRIWISLMKEN